MRASTPTVATAETTRQVNVKPVNNGAATALPKPAKLAAGSVHMTNPGGGKLPSVTMAPTHNYSTGMAGVNVKHKV